MKTIFALALATILASPALAQSYDPDLGTGNIAPPAAVRAPAVRAYPMSPQNVRTAQPSLYPRFGEARAEAIGGLGGYDTRDDPLFDRAKGHID